MMNEEDSSRGSSGSPFGAIPPSIVSDILSRIPTMTCLKCKLVCKEWYQIIMSMEFAEVRRSRGSYFSLLFYGKFYNCSDNFLLLDLDKTSKVGKHGNLCVESKTRFTCDFNLPNSKLHLCNECNGVICLKDQEMWSPFIVCNPLTGQFGIIEQSRKAYHLLQGYGLGYCSVSRQFKVLRIMLGKFNYVAEVQTVGTNQWRSVGAAHICKERIGAFLHSSLHWYSSKDHCIWSFHFGNEQFLRIPVPENTKGTSAADVTIFDSYLCFSCVPNDGCQRDIWLMKEYGVCDTWVKQFVIEKGEFGMLYVPILRMGCGEILVSFRGRSNLLAYDLKSETYKKVRVDGVSFFDVVPFHMNLSEI